MESHSFLWTMYLAISQTGLLHWTCNFGRARVAPHCSLPAPHLSLPAPRYLSTKPWALCSTFYGWKGVVSDMVVFTSNCFLAINVK